MMALRKESAEEQMFSAWANEAVDHGLVRHYVKQPNPFDLTPPQFTFIDKQLKTKVKQVKRSVCRAHIYTADFCLMLTDEGISRFRGIFQNTHLLGFPDGFLWIDTKGGFMDRGKRGEFSINQKLVYDKYGVWVSKVVPFVGQLDKRGNPKAKPPPCLFVKTWCPESYRWLKGRRQPTLSVKGAQCSTIADFLAAV